MLLPVVGAVGTGTIDPGFRQSQGQFALMLSQRRKSGVCNAILYDSGATALMTNSLDGLVGSLLTVKGEDFTTAMGVKTFRQKGFMVKHVFGKNGMSAPLPDYY